MTHSSCVQIITKDNLTFVTNARHQDIETRYEITNPPHDGEVQRQHYPDYNWAVTTTFTQQHIDRHRVRYVHFNDSQASNHQQNALKLFSYVICIQ